MNETIKPTGKLTRRDFLKITAVAAATLAGGGGTWAWLQQRPGRIQQTRLLMGTVVNLTVVAEDAKAAREAVDATFAEMQRLIAIYTSRQSRGALAKLNRHGGLANPPRELVSLLRKANYYADLSSGAFDVTVKPVLDAYQLGQALTPEILSLVDYHKLKITDTALSFEKPGMQVTVDGIAKGAVVDGAVAVLNAHGLTNVLVEAGGDLLANGLRDTKDTWNVGVQDPRHRDTFLATFPIQGRAAATSGDYMHAFTQDYSLNHIIVPGTGLSPAELSSATLLAPTATDADALSTTLMVLGTQKGLALVESLPGIEAMLINKQLEIATSSGFPKPQI